jgi:hypothetical protein
LHLWQNSIDTLAIFVIKASLHTTCHLNHVDTEYIMPLALLALTIGAFALAEFVIVGIMIHWRLFTLAGFCWWRCMGFVLAVAGAVPGNFFP